VANCSTKKRDQLAAVVEDQVDAGPIELRRKRRLGCIT